MTRCPSRDELTHALAGSPSSAVENEALAAHLAICPRCRDLLDSALEHTQLPGDGASSWEPAGHGSQERTERLTVNGGAAEPVPAGGDGSSETMPSGRFAADEALERTRRDIAASSTETPPGEAATIDGRLPIDDLPATLAGPEGEQTIDQREGRTVSLRGLPTEPIFPTSGRSEVGTTLAGFEILAELGRGGMGVVYKARHCQLNRLVALKMIAGDHRHPEQLARFRIEAEAVARLQHPNVIHVYDVGEIDGRPYVTLELLEGGSLSDRLKGDPLASRAAADLMIPLALAMDSAHRAGIAHRDLKPANVLFTIGGVPKVTDFGLAKRLEVDDGQTRTGDIMGTPSYMAPEQAMGLSKDVGPQADIYALGAILYEMLTGRPPFKGPTPISTVRQIVEGEPVSPSRLQSGVPRDLETICLKCLEKDPRRRYASAHDLADDLTRFLRSEPIRARPTPSWEARESG